MGKFMTRKVEETRENPPHSECCYTDHTVSWHIALRSSTRYTDKVGSLHNCRLNIVNDNVRVHY
jgi:hypothetical protein